MKPTLVLLAAGMSTRYGRLKQLEPVGPEGEALLDFAVFDAIRAGFDRVVLIIREELEEAFREHIKGRWPSDLAVVYHHQRLDDLPGAGPGAADLVARRTKPWGTAHALLTARPHLTGPFVLLNADDFYGSEAYEKAAGFVAGLGGSPSSSGSADGAESTFGLVTYTLEDTLSDHGGVNRGVCRVTGARETDDGGADVGGPEDGEMGWLAGVQEVLDIRRENGSLAGKTEKGDPVQPTGSEAVSMNYWIFTPDVFPILERRLAGFLSEAEADPDSNPEFLIPTVVNEAVAEGEARVGCLPTGGRFLGITHPPDREWVVTGLERLTREGRYPRPLWG